MSFLVKVEGSESFEVAKECVRSVNVTTDIPLDSNARTKDVGATMVITGKILAALDGDITDSTRKFHRPLLTAPADSILPSVL